MGNDNFLKNNEKGGEYTIIAVYRYLGGKIANLLKNTHITANQITFFSIIISIFAAYCFFVGNYTTNVIGALLIQVAILFDYTDGIIARIKKEESNFGQFFDMTAGYFRETLLPFSICWSIYNSTHLIQVWILGYFIISGSLLIRLIDKSVKNSLLNLESMINLKKKSNIIIKQLFNVTFTKYIILLFAAIINQMYYSLIVISIYLSIALFGSIFVVLKNAKLNDISLKAESHT